MVIVMVHKRIENLRSVMAERNINAYIINGSDPHRSEYPPPRWMTRSWLTGFTGSAGTVVVTMDKAGVWTDSRYFLQAAEELGGSDVELFKMGLPGVPDFMEWLRLNLTKAQVVGSNAFTTTMEEKSKIQESLEGTGIMYRPCEDLLDLIWEERPSLPDAEIFQLDLKYSGRDRKDKIGEIREVMKRDKADWYLISSLSDIAWVLNLRGDDIPYNPLFLAFLLISREEVVLFTGIKKVSADLKTILKISGIRIEPYEFISDFIRKLNPSSVLISPEATSIGLSSVFEKRWSIIKKPDVTTEMKAVKNEVELSGIRNAMIKDGIALVKFLKWLEYRWQTEKLDEVSIAEKLTEFRSMQDGFMGPSFETISGFNDHGAIVHYSADKETAYLLDKAGILLLDSGGQYLDGTTDITRVIVFGDAADNDARRDYTLVLKGHIDLAGVQFPAGTNGIQLDTLARYNLWMEGKNYLHGTGHGVGHFLTVHEGPQSISPRQPSSVIKPGMIISNEPGFYREGKYGIRIENLVTVIQSKTTESGEFLKFETLTLCPYERELIDTSLLTGEQLKWINEYHKRVYTLLSPRLDNEEKDWLRKKTGELK